MKRQEGSDVLILTPFSGADIRTLMGLKSGAKKKNTPLGRLYDLMAKFERFQASIMVVNLKCISPRLSHDGSKE